MNIIFDISALGAGNFDQRAKTGIFRVVHNLARELAASPHINSRFCGQESFILLMETMSYLEKDEALQNSSFCTPTSNLFPFIHKIITSLQKEIKVRETLYGRKCLSAKVLRTFRTFVNKSIVGMQALDPDLLLDEQYIKDADIYHSPFYPLPRSIKKISPNIRLVLTVHDLIPIKFPEYFQFNEKHMLHKTIDSIKQDEWAICVSQSTKNDLCEYRRDINPDNVFVTHLAASDLFYQCADQALIKTVREKFNIPEDARYLLSLSTLEPRKNIKTTIKSFIRLISQEKMKDLYLVLAGPTGWNYADIFDEVEQAEEIKNQILFTGFVNDIDMAPLYSGALAFVYPSLYEGFGLPLIEAMKCGVPVITSNISSIPEVVGDAAILLDPEDINTLCQKIYELYFQPEYVNSLSSKSIQQASHFSWEKCIRQTIAAYNIILCNQ